MLYARAALIVFLVCVGSALCLDLIPVTGYAVGSAGNGTIWYQSDSDMYFAWGNVMNPIQVMITYNSGSPISEAEVCLNSFEQTYPISGANLIATCPRGGYGTVSNATEIIIYANQTTKYQGISRMALDDTTNATTETYAASVYVKPTNGGAFIVTIPDNNDTQLFQITYSGMQCRDNMSYPVGKNNTCETIPSMQVNTQQLVTLQSNEVKYFQVTTLESNPSLNELYVFYNSSDVELYVQRDYYPTREWYIETLDESHSDNIESARILTPGTFTAGETYFFMLNNTMDSTTTIFFNTTNYYCENIYVFGSTCSHNIGNNVDPSIGVYLISANLSNPSSSTNDTLVNDGSALSFNLNDDDFEQDYAYFTISDYPLYPTPYYIRVTVANNDVTDSNGAPSLFGKRGGYPSEQSNHYNISAQGDVANQMLIKIDAEDLVQPIVSENIWYFAVKLPVDFSIWVGVNCAGNCDNQQYGYCMCDDQPCQNITSNFENAAVFYHKPSSILDSAGACKCLDDDYDSSFNCSELNNPYFWLWITILCVVLALVVVFGVGVPLLCFISNRKPDNFETM